MESWKRLNGETVERVIVKSQCEVVSGLTPDTTCWERINPRPTSVVCCSSKRSFLQAVDEFFLPDKFSYGLS